MPWNEYGDVRGLNAPPRSACAPAALTASAAASTCSLLSIAHGPAITANRLPPISILPTLIRDPSGRTSRDASLNDRTTGITRSTPATDSRCVS